MGIAEPEEVVAAGLAFFSEGTRAVAGEPAGHGGCAHGRIEVVCRAVERDAHVDRMPRSVVAQQAFEEVVTAHAGQEIRAEVERVVRRVQVRAGLVPGRVHRWPQRFLLKQLCANDAPPPDVHAALSAGHVGGEEKHVGVLVGSHHRLGHGASGHAEHHGAGVVGVAQIHRADAEVPRPVLPRKVGPSPVSGPGAVGVVDAVVHVVGQGCGCIPRTVHFLRPEDARMVIRRVLHRTLGVHFTAQRREVQSAVRPGTRTEFAIIAVHRHRQMLDLHQAVRIRHHRLCQAAALDPVVRSLCDHGVLVPFLALDLGPGLLRIVVMPCGHLHFRKPAQRFRMLHAPVLPFHLVIEQRGLAVLVAQAAGLGIFPLRLHDAGFHLQRFAVVTGGTVDILQRHRTVAPSDELRCALRMQLLQHPAKQYGKAETDPKNVVPGMRLRPFQGRKKRVVFNISNFFDPFRAGNFCMLKSFGMAQLDCVRPTVRRGHSN